MDNTNQDVNQVQVDMSTTVVPSNDEQTSVAPDTQETVSPEPTEVKTVPYDRFKEVNDELRGTSQTVQQLQAEMQMLRQQQMQFQQPQYQPQVDPQAQMQEQAIMQQLTPFLEKYARDNGLVSRQELERQEQDRRLQEDITRLKATYTGKDGRPAFDERRVMDHAYKNGFPNLEKAYKDLHEADLINWHVQQAIAKSKGLQTESSNSSGSTQVGVTDDDLIKAASSGDTNAQHLFAKRLLASRKS